MLREEDEFPKTFTNFEERDFGILFYNEQNKLSYDSNHALIYKENITDLTKVLNEITDFYVSKQIHPSIYQAAEDDGYFITNKTIFKDHGYRVWEDEAKKFMILSAENKLNDNITNQLDIKLVTEWDERIATDICIPSDEAYEIEVAKNSIKSDKHRVFVGYKGEKAIALTYFHISEKYNCCRFDYIMISKDYRKRGYARELLSYVTDYCREHKIENCFQWPAHETSERICYEAGFRTMFTIDAGRASYKKK